MTRRARRLLRLSLPWFLLGAMGGTVVIAGASETPFRNWLARVGLPEGAAATTAAMNLYVDATNGADTNSGLSTSTALQTIQAAINKIPKRIRHPVTVTVAAGSYSSGAYIEGFTCEPGASSTTGAYLIVTGATANFSPTTGSATGTATGSANNLNMTPSTLTDSGANWTAGNFDDGVAYLEITGGTGSGQVRPLASNTGTALTIVGTWSTAPNTTSTYAIRDWTTVMTGALSLPPVPLFGSTTATANLASFVVSNVRGGATMPITGTGTFCVSIERFKTTATPALVDVRNSDGVMLRWNRGTAITANGMYRLTNVSNISMMESSANYAGKYLVAIQRGSVTNHTQTVRNIVRGGSGLWSGMSSTGLTTANPYGFGSFTFTSNDVKSANVAVITGIGGGCFDCLFQIERYNTNSGGHGIEIGNGLTGMGSSAGSIIFFGGQIDSMTGDAVRVRGTQIVRTSLGLGALAGTSNTGFGFTLLNGARLSTNCSTEATVTGTGGDISFDGTNLATTYANCASVLSVQDSRSMSWVTTNQTLATQPMFIGDVPSFRSMSDSTGTPGDCASCNTVMGKSAIAGAATAAVITNSNVTANSAIGWTFRDLDATCTQMKVVAGSGSFTATCNAAATGTTKFDWWVTGR